MDAVELLRAVLGSAVILFLPGFSWSLVLLAGQEVGVVGRVATSFGLSLVLVPLTVFWLNLTLGLKVTPLNTVLVTLALSAAPPAYLWARMRLAKRDDSRSMIP
ncbi:MAG: DUF1616 domain-containing protein [Chloroflexota bacterium]